MPIPEPRWSELYAQGIDLFNNGEFFDCHEVLEEIWTPEQGPRRLYLQSLIHVAVGLYHHEHANCIGAERQLRKALRKMAQYLPAYEGVDTARLHRDTQGCLERVLRNDAPVRPQIHRAPAGKQEESS